jgi:hypothetical protein
MEYAEIVKIFDREEYAAFVKIMAGAKGAMQGVGSGHPSL